MRSRARRSTLHLLRYQQSKSSDGGRGRENKTGTMVASRPLRDSEAQPRIVQRDFDRLGPAYEFRNFLRTAAIASLSTT